MHRISELFNVVVSKYSEDLLKYGGILETIRDNYNTSSLFKLALRRLPMIVVPCQHSHGGIVAAFEDVISRVAILVAFMPMLAS